MILVVQHSKHFGPNPLTGNITFYNIKFYKGRKPFFNDIFKSYLHVPKG